MQLSASSGLQICKPVEPRVLKAQQCFHFLCADFFPRHHLVLPPFFWQTLTAADGRILSLKLILVRGLINFHSSSHQSFCTIWLPTVSLKLIKR